MMMNLGYGIFKGQEEVLIFLKKNEI